MERKSGIRNNQEWNSGNPGRKSRKENQEWNILYIEGYNVTHAGFKTL